MSDQVINVQNSGPGSVDVSQVSTTSGSVSRQRVVLGNDSGSGVIDATDIIAGFQMLARMAIVRITQQSALSSPDSQNGFVPIETLDFLGGF